MGLKLNNNNKYSMQKDNRDIRTFNACKGIKFLILKTLCVCVFVYRKHRMLSA